MSRTIRTFPEMLGLLSRGKFQSKLNEELASAIAALEGLPNDEGKATISITLQLAYKGGRMDVKPTVKTKLPESAAFQDTPFWTHEGELSVQHPSQMDMYEPREVQPGTQAKA